MKITTNCIYVNQNFRNKKEAIIYAGQQLLNHGCITNEYIDTMLKRDEELSVYLGNQLAIPHGTFAGKKYVKKTGIVVITTPNGVNFDGNQVKLLVAIAAKDDEHLSVLSKIAIKCSDIDGVNKIVAATNKQVISDLLGGI